MPNPDRLLSRILIRHSAPSKGGMACIERLEHTVFAFRFYRCEVLLGEKYWKRGPGLLSLLVVRLQPHLSDESIVVKIHIDRGISHRPRLPLDTIPGRHRAVLRLAKLSHRQNAGYLSGGGLRGNNYVVRLSEGVLHHPVFLRIARL